MKNEADSKKPLCALLMAGGSGLRLWPLSRPSRTKPFLKRFGQSGSLLAETAARLPFVPAERTFVNVTRGLEGLVEGELPGLPKDHVIVAPEDRDTLPALAFATSHIARTFPDATLILLASDNTIGDVEAFHEALGRCVSAARAGSHLVSLGIAPTEASTRFGYMALGEPYPDLSDTWFGTGYVEKPEKDVAEALFAGGVHDWNSGIFVWTIATFRSALEAYAPSAARLFGELCMTEDPHERSALFRCLEAVAVDHGLLERVPAAGGAVRHVFVRGRFPWDDLGTFDALTKGQPVDSNGNLVTANVHAVDCKDSMLVTEGKRQLDAVGLEGLCVVVSDDGDTLVSTRAGLADIRGLLASPGRVELRVDDGALRFKSPSVVRLFEAEGCVVAESPAVVGLLRVHGVSVTVEANRVRVSRSKEAREAQADVPSVYVAADDVEFSRVGASLVITALTEALLSHDAKVFVTMSAGETPIGIYRTLVEQHRTSLDWSRIHFVQMDEWAGVGPNDPRSFAYELRETLTNPLGMPTTLLDGLASADSVSEIEADVLANGGFCFALHGIGTNGHHGFNEPPDDGTSRARLAILAPETRAAAARRFGGSAPTHGLTLGLLSLAHAKKTLLVARGAKKTDSLRASWEKPNASSPASHLVRTSALDVLVDRVVFEGLAKEVP